MIPLLFSSSMSHDLLVGIADGEATTSRIADGVDRFGMHAQIGIVKEAELRVRNCRTTSKLTPPKTETPPWGSAMLLMVQLDTFLFLLMVEVL